MSLRLDPRRLSTLKRLAAEVGMRPGDLVRTWVEERIDAERGGAPGAERGGAPAADGMLARLDELAARVAALETAAAATGDRSAADPEPQQAPDAESRLAAEESADPDAERPGRTRRNAVSAAPSPSRVALHDEMIEVLRERGPMTAAELAGAIAERGRYAPPRSGKALDAAMVSQRVSNPTYRGRFTRNEGRIGLAEEAG